MQVRRLLSSAVAVFAALAVFAPSATSQIATPLLRERFERYGTVTWPQLKPKGPWYVEYNGYGKVSTVKHGSTVLRLRPKAATDLGTTHAAFVTSRKEYTSPVAISARMKTVKQLRLNATPHAWEVGWLAWNHKHDHHFYYVILKPNGLELGKVDNVKADPDGPACLWPEYKNCRYPGAQKYLLTDGHKKFPVGQWYDLKVTQVGRVISIFVNGVPVGTYTDKVRVYGKGSVGLYTEDADVRFDDVLVAAL